MPANPRELVELGECLSCLAVRSGVPLARCACGAVASGEAMDGPICDKCQQERKARFVFARMEEEERSERNRARAAAAHAKWNRQQERERATRATDPANRAGNADAIPA